MKKYLGKRMTALLLALVMCMGLVVPAGAADTGTSVKVEKADNSAVSVSLTDDGQQTALENEEAPLYEDTDTVRVSIVLDGKSTLKKGFSTMSIADNNKAMAYRSSLQAQQAAVTQKISRNALDGENLDVVWNLTLAANIISANVSYGDIDAIKAVSGVADVVLETRYEPQVASVDALNPNMATSGSMIGSPVAYAAGYNGAGSRIAVIDTGTDTDHQSFNADAFQHAIDKDKANGKTVSLMTKDTLTADVISKLNIGKNAGVTADSLYRNAKLPFAYNYVDGDLDVTHDNDSQGEHGSHVAGIATANRYIKNDDGTYSDALEVAHMQGVAPDAQLITMKVFGKSGGAYDSDYMAAIEDAILLKCDSINLSLGSATAGMTYNSTYQDILNDLVTSDTVVSISAGNSGYWAENAATGGYLYADDVNFHTGGSPGTYTNAFTVASADNIGVTGTPLQFGTSKVFYSETDYKNAKITTLDKSADGTGTEYDFIYTTGVGAAAELEALKTAGVDFTDKVVLVSRGTTSFYEKHMAVADVGGAVCIVVNNAAGEINMDLSDSTATIPCVSISQADGQSIKEAATAVKDADENVLYYTGKVTISSAVSSGIINDSKNYTMSSFSSWGVPGTLQLKPEITAPGGNIYSVNGADKSGKGYENMSGTSMAAPQVAGMAALAAQYLKEKNIKVSGLTRRSLIQSLLMSTAVPMKTEKGTYYSLLQQGAGLANIGDAINAHSYITMDTAATSGAADGKVKVELGDDPAKTGVYSFGFTLHDLSGNGGTYALSGDVFTQATFTEDGIDYLDTATAALAGAKVSFDQSSVTLAAGGTAHVTVTIDVTGCTALKNYPNGTYLQAFVTAAEQSTTEGEKGTTHSIPVLGFYGNWSDPSMYDGLNNGQPTDKEQYVGATNLVVYAYAGEIYQRLFGSNRYDEDEEILEDRNSLNNTTGEKLIGIGYSAIRNAGGSILQVVDAETGKVYVRHDTGANYAAYYYTSTSQSQWLNYGGVASFRWSGADQDGSPLPEGTKVRYEMVLAPEYYAGDDGSYDWDALTDGDPSNGELGKGVSLGTTLTIDNTAPEVLSAKVNGSTLTINAIDNRYIACVALTNAGGNKILKKIFPNQQTANTEYSCDIDLSASYGKEFFVAVCDYAGNQTVYQVTLDEAFNGAETNGAIMGATSSEVWNAMKDGSVAKFDDADNQYFGAAYVGGKVYLTNSNGLYVADMDSLARPTFLVSYPNVIVTALAYDYKAETLYGAALNASTGDAQLVTLELGSGTMTVIGDMAVETNMLATDSKGNFYSITANGDLYTFTLDTLSEPTKVGATGYLNNYIQGLTYNNSDGQLYWAQYYATKSAVRCDINGDGKTNAADAQLILDYASGKLTAEEIAEKSYNFKKADLNSDGDITTFDAYLLLNLNASNSEVANLLQVNTKDGSTELVTPLPTETAALFAPDNTRLPAALKKTSATSVVISQDTLSLAPTVSAQLTAFAAPWTLADTSVTWASSNEDVATVDETGLVTAHTVGTATITASANTDPAITNECTVTVTAVDVTITGALQDASRKSQLFTWNMGKDNTWTPGAALDNSVEAVTTDAQGNIWQMDAYDYYMHKVSADGKTLDSYQGLGTPMADIGYSPFFSEQEGKAQIYGVYQWHLYLQQDPTALTSDYMDMIVYLMLFAGAGEFVATTSGIPGTIIDTEGAAHEGETVYMVDNGGNIWNLGFYEDGGNVSATFGFVPSDNLTYPALTYPGEGANKNCSLVVADNGDLFFSYYNGSNNVLYRLTLNEDEGMYNATLIGDFGKNVRPAALLSAKYNDGGQQTNSTASLSAADALFTGTVAELNAKSEAYAAQLNTTLTHFNLSTDAPASRSSAGTLSVTPSQGDSKSVTLDLTAKSSTNGKLTVSYDTSVLTLDSVEPTSLALNSYVTAENGTVTFAYANKTAVSGKLATLTLSYDSTTAPSTTVATVTMLEEGGSQKTVEQKVTLKLKDEVIDPDPDPKPDPDPITPVIPVTPSKPSKPTTPADKSFDDVKPGDWFYNEVLDMADNGYINGVSDRLFAPYENLSRAMLVTILYRMDGEKAVSGSSAFTDVVKGSWYDKAVAWASANGIVTGYDASHFGPNDYVTRQQMASILWRYAKYKSLDVAANGTVMPDFPDRGQIASWAGEAVSWAYSRGIMGGRSDGRLDPNGKATRAEAAVMLSRFLKLTPKGEKQ